LKAIPKNRYVKAGDPLVRMVEIAQKGYQDYRDMCERNRMRMTEHLKKKREAQ
jgi:hypothetical protein